jgi:hypothetical protein
MSFQENILGFVQSGSDLTSAGAALTGPPARLDKPDLRHSISKRSDSNGRTRLPNLNPQDLVGLLFRQRARARMAALPRVCVSVSVFSPSGRPAVQISL